MQRFRKGVAAACFAGMLLAGMPPAAFPETGRKAATEELSSSSVWKRMREVRGPHLPRFGSQVSQLELARQRLPAARSGRSSRRRANVAAATAATDEQDERHAADGEALAAPGGSGGRRGRRQGGRFGAEQSGAQGDQTPPVLLHAIHFLGAEPAFPAHQDRQRSRGGQGPRRPHERHGTGHLHFVDDAMSIDRDRMVRLCQGLLDRKLPVTWSMMTRVDAVDEAMLK